MATTARTRPGVGSPRSLRQLNRSRVVAALRRDGALTQSDLARRTGLSRATVFNIVRELSEGGLVSVSEDGPRTGRGLRVAFSRRAGVAVGIDVDHRRLRVAVSDLNHELLAERGGELMDSSPAAATTAAALDLVEAALADADAGRDDVVGVGMCLPAPIDPVTGTVGATSILPGWVGTNAAAFASDAFGLAVHVDNDANLGALAELTWGAGRGVDDLLYVKLGTGVGAGVVLGGDLHRGIAGAAGELGHTTIDERGPVCRCGNRGCLEAVIGGEALRYLLRHTHGADLSVRAMVAAALDGDAACQRVIADAGQHAGVALANACNLLAPARVVVGGELAAAGDLLLEPLTKALHSHVLRPLAETLDVRTAALGDRAEVLGAIAVVLRREDPLHPAADVLA